MAGQAQRHETNGKLEDHIRLIRGEIAKSVDDPATRQLASAIISGSYDNVVDPRSGVGVPCVPYYQRWFRAAPDWEHAAVLCQMRDYACEVKKIWTFGILNWRYQQDQDGEDTYATLRATMEAGGGDCDDMTIAFASLLKAVGYENVVARVVSVQGSTWDHIYTLVQIPGTGRWISLDITEPNKPFGWEFQGVAAKRDFAL